MAELVQSLTLQPLFEQETPGLDHGGLTGLMDDDHPQYLTQARAAALFLTQAEADARYYTEAEADALFLTQAEADALFLTQAEAEALYAPRLVRTYWDAANRYSYVGTAPAGTATNAPSWTVTRLTIAADGSLGASVVTTCVAWDTVEAPVGIPISVIDEFNSVGSISPNPMTADSYTWKLHEADAAVIGGHRGIYVWSPYYATGGGATWMESEYVVEGYSGSLLFSPQVIS